jgi:hypothetical protein
MARDPGEHAIQILDYLIVPEPQHPIPLAIQESRALEIVRRRLGMSAAVDLDDQFRAVRSEVGEITPERYLPAKSRVGQAFAQGSPQHLLGVR